MKPYKVYLFLNVFYVDDQRLKTILFCIRKPGVTTLFVYAQGIAGNTISQRNMELLTGIKLDCDVAGGIIRVQTSGSVRLPEAEYGLSTSLTPQVYSVDPDTEVLGLIVGSVKHGLVRKQTGTASSIFSAAPRVPTSVLRSLFRSAGCRIYTENGELVYANKSFVAVCGMPGKKIAFNISPDKMLFELFSSTEHMPVKGSLTLPPSPTGVWAFFRGTRQEWEALQA
jgi:hypothetical protein